MNIKHFLNLSGRIGASYMLLSQDQSHELYLLAHKGGRLTDWLTEWLNDCSAVQSNNSNSHLHFIPVTLSNIREGGGMVCTGYEWKVTNNICHHHIIFCFVFHYTVCAFSVKLLFLFNLRLNLLLPWQREHRQIQRCSSYVMPTGRSIACLQNRDYILLAITILVSDTSQLISCETFLWNWLEFTYIW